MAPRTQREIQIGRTGGRYEKPGRQASRAIMPDGREDIAGVVSCARTTMQPPPSPGTVPRTRHLSPARNSSIPPFVFAAPTRKSRRTNRLSGHNCHLFLFAPLSCFLASVQLSGSRSGSFSCIRLGNKAVQAMEPHNIAIALSLGCGSIPVGERDVSAPTGAKISVFCPGQPPVARPRRADTGLIHQDLRCPGKTLARPRFGPHPYGEAAQCARNCRTSPCTGFPPAMHGRAVRGYNSRTSYASDAWQTCKICNTLNAQR